MAEGRVWIMSGATRQCEPAPDTINPQAPPETLQQPGRPVPEVPALGDDGL